MFPMNDEGVSDVNMNVTRVEEEDSVLIEGTIYTSPSGGGSVYYINPVFQSADGSIYTVSGSGMSSESSSAGDGYSMSLDQAFTVTENGKFIY